MTARRITFVHTQLYVCVGLSHNEKLNDFSAKNHTSRGRASRRRIRELPPRRTSLRQSSPTESFALQ